MFNAYLNNGGIEMTKAELVEFIAENADLTKADAARALDAVVEGVTEGLKKSGKVTLVGFGTFGTSVIGLGSSTWLISNPSFSRYAFAISLFTIPS